MHFNQAAVKKIKIILISFIISSACNAQEKKPIVFITYDSDDQQVALIDKTTFDNIRISGLISMDMATKPNSIGAILNAFGDPSDLKHDQDIANDGITVIFETKILRYSGIEFIFPMYDDLELSIIEITSPDHSLNINDISLIPGRKLSDYHDLLPVELISSGKQTIHLQVAEIDESGNFKQSSDGKIQMSFESINVKHDPTSKVITQIDVIRRFN
jgi:hypothetical protein